MTQPTSAAELAAAQLGEVEPQQIRRGDLGEERLGGGDGDLRPAWVYRTASDSRGIVDPWALQIERSWRRARGRADGHQRVHRLARLMIDTTSVRPLITGSR